MSEERHTYVACAKCGIGIRYSKSVKGMCNPCAEEAIAKLYGELKSARTEMERQASLYAEASRHRTEMSEECDRLREENRILSYNASSDDTSDKARIRELEKERDHALDRANAMRTILQTVWTVFGSMPSMKEVERAYRIGWSDGVSDEQNDAICYSATKGDERWTEYVAEHYKKEASDGD